MADYAPGGLFAISFFGVGAYSELGAYSGLELIRDWGLINSASKTTKTRK